ncbi:MAG: vitamin B12 dependent methionine synthase [Clostridiales bacterium]|jgi:hypothetical protein|nr:vitamin B12 dependent methionine synthase [Clostridiales bacterium]
MIRKIDAIPLTTTFEQVLNTLRITDDEDIAVVRGLFETAKGIAKPKVLYREVFVEEISGRNVRINGFTFESDVLAANLKNIHRVFAYVSTCGTEADEFSAGEKDYVVSFWLDMIKEMFLRETNLFFRDYIKNAYQFEKLSSINPGSGNENTWHISQQKLLFDMIGNVKEEIGVTLTDSFLMLPVKSTSGLIYPSETEFVNCALCVREKCPGRRTEFDSKLYAQIFKQ